jgi:hypothetical protein
MSKKRPGQTTIKEGKTTSGLESILTKGIMEKKWQKIIQTITNKASNTI